MTTPTYDLLYNIDITTAAASVTFSNVLTTAAGYADLVISVDMIDTSNGSGITMFLNNATSGFLYDIVGISGSGSTFATYKLSNTNEPLFAYFAVTKNTTRSLYKIDLFDFASTTKHKTALARNSNAQSGVEAWAYKYESTTAVNTIKLQLTGLSKFAVGSTIKIYGIKAVA